MLLLHTREGRQGMLRDERQEHVPNLAGGRISIRLAAGNLDADWSEELVRTVHDYAGSLDSPAATTPASKLESHGHDRDWYRDRSSYDAKALGTTPVRAAFSKRERKEEVGERP